MQSNINIIVPSADEEFMYVWSLLEQMQWFREHKYRVKLPSEREFLIAAIYAPYSFRTGEKEFLKKLFESKVFSNETYEADYKLLIEKTPIFNEILELFSSWNDLIGFDVWPEYTIKLTQYGPGGGTFADKHLIKVIVNKVGGILTIFQTVVHEMVHVGVEHIFVEKIKLSQMEKETLVDWICKNHLTELMPDYPLHQDLSEKMLTLLNGKTMVEVEDTLKSWKDNQHEL